MSYRTILLDIGIDGPSAAVTKAAVDLAVRLDARLIGFSAADAPMPMAGPDAGGLAAQTWMQMRDDIQSRFGEMRARFAGLVGGAVESEWREALDNPTRALVREARAADLIVMGAAEGAATGDAYRRADPGSAALQAGRPLLVVAHGAVRVPAEAVVVAWKDTREARRAVADAVPLLTAAREVVVVTVAKEADAGTARAVADVAAFLGRHGVKARSEVVRGGDDGGRLVDFIAASKADLVVSGAYGHSRLREWAFGGVTRSLLDETGLNRLMSG